MVFTMLGKRKKCRVGPVPRRLRGRAIDLLTGGIRSRVVATEQAIDSRQGDEVWFWCLRRWWRVSAAALVIENPGKTGMLFYSSCLAQGLESGVLEELIGLTCRKALAGGGLSLVQAMVSPSAELDIGVLSAVGFEPLVELSYMRLDLVSKPHAANDASLTWRNFEKFSGAELAEVITATYEDSRDCPNLRGLRRVSDVITGHKANGIFAPQSWWIATRGGVPVGCVLVNDSLSGGTAEIVYLGVVKSARGGGLGRELLRYAAGQAFDRGMSALKLAVDKKNVFAKELYEREGFYEVDKRLVCIISRK